MNVGSLLGPNVDPYTEDQNRADRLERWARSSLWEDGRAKLISSFVEFCGGEFVLQ